MGEVIYLKGPSEIVWRHETPLSPEIEKQVVRHELVRVNEDGTAWVEPETGEPPALTRPADSAVKAAWVGYAVARSEQLGQPITVDQADAMTKADLITRYGAQEPQVPAQVVTDPTPPAEVPPADPPADPPAQEA